MPQYPLPDWTVLLIGGPSSVGKSTAAKQIARRFGKSWHQVDDLRLALQWSGASLPNPEDTRKRYFFDETPDVWRLPAERLRDGFIGVGESLSPAIAKVVTNHVATREPIVLEGDGLLPSLLDRHDVRQYAGGGRVRAVFVVPPDEQAIHDNMVARGWGILGQDDWRLEKNAHAKWLYGQWLVEEATRRGLPVLESQPQETLVERIVTASNAIAELRPEPRAAAKASFG